MDLAHAGEGIPLGSAGYDLPAALAAAADTGPLEGAGHAGAAPIRLAAQGCLEYDAGMANMVILVGKLAGQPALKHSQNGRAFLMARVETTRSFRGRDGTARQATEWHNVRVWGDKAAALASELSEGQWVTVQGRLEYWESDKGRQAQITAQEMAPLASQRRQAQAPAQPPPQPQQQSLAPPPDDDIPF